MVALVAEVRRYSRADFVFFGEKPGAAIPQNPMSYGWYRTAKRFHDASHDQRRTHLADFMATYTFARRLKTLCGLTPYNTSPKSASRSKMGLSSIRSTRCRG